MHNFFTVSMDELLLLTDCNDPYFLIEHLTNMGNVIDGQVFFTLTPQLIADTAMVWNSTRSFNQLVTQKVQAIKKLKEIRLSKLN